MPSGQDDPGLLESLENKVADLSDEHRATLPESERTEYDVKIGIAKGAYGFTKSLVSSLIDMSSFCVKLFSGDQEAWKKVGFAAWDVAKFVGRNLYYEHIASLEDKQRYEKELDDKFNAMYQVAKNKVVKDWEEAKAKGKEAEVISKWSTRGVLEIASLFVGAGEVKAAAEASELSKAAKVLEGAEVACDLEKGTDGAKAIQAASEADKTAEAARASKAVPQPTSQPALRPGAGEGEHTATWHDSPKSAIDFSVKDNEANVPGIWRGEQPEGSAGAMLAQSLKKARTPKPKSITFSSISNKEALQAIEKGSLPADTKLGKTLSNAASELGGKVTKWETGVDLAGKPFIKGTIDYQ